MDGESGLNISPEDVKSFLTSENIRIMADVVLSEKDLLEVRLEDIVVTGFGWTDPIGQLQSWLADRLREVASWFSATVGSVFSDFYDRVIKGGLSWVINSISSALSTVSSSITSALSSVISGVYNYIVQGVTGLASSIGKVYDYIVSGLKWVVDQVSSGVKALVDGLSSAIGSAISGLSSTLGSLWSWIKSGIEGLSGALSKVWDYIVSGLQWVASQVLSGVKGFIDAVWSGIQVVASQLGSLLNTVWEWIKTGVQGITSFLSKMWDYIVSGLQWVASQVVSGVKGFIDWLWSGIQWLGSQLSGIINTVWEWIKSGVQGLAGALSKIWDYIVSGFKWVVEQVSSGIRGFVDWVWSGLQWVWSQVSNIFNTLWGWIKSGIEGLAGVLSKVWDYVVSGFKWISDQVASSVRGFAEWVWSGIQMVWSQISGVLGRIWDGIVSGFRGLGDALSRLWAWMGGVFGQLASGLAEFSKYVYNFGAMVMGGIQNIANFIVNLPSSIQSVFKGVVDFFKWLYEGLVEFFRDPLGFLKTKIFEPLVAGVKWLVDRVMEGLQWLWSGLVNALRWLWGSMQGVFSSLLSWFSSGINWVFSTVVNAAKSLWSTLVSALVPIAVDLAGTIQSGLASVVKAVSSTILSPLVSIVKSALSASGIGSPEWATDRAVERLQVEMSNALTSMFGLYLLGGGLAKSLGYFIKGSAMNMGQWIRHLKGILNLFGVRVEVESSMLEGIGAVWYNFGDFVQSIPETIAGHVMHGIAVWMGQPLARIILHNLADYLPFYIPDMGVQLEVVRRGWWADKYPAVVSKKEELVNVVDFYMGLYMVPQFYRKMLLSDEFYVKIQDRFLAERTIPLSLRYTLPSPSETVRWLIRDIVIPPEASAEFIERNMKRLLGVRGIPEDVAKLYYIAHFRYPSPRALSRFYFRAMAKLLWLPTSLEEPAIVSVVGAPAGAKSPRELNAVDFDTVHRAISYYWKWHDYAPFTWMPGFTTDKAIMMELAADLPTRIDLRWLVRWGVFEHLIKIVGKTTASIDDIRSAVLAATGTEVFSSKVTPEIVLDVRLLARFLTATGYLPDVVPMLSVAQTHQVLADEMTLVRTGFVSGFREGVLTLDASESLMSGLFIIQFKTAYFDSSAKAWVDVTYRKPLFWLPAERRLLQLRAVFDRHVDLWRDFMREVVNGVRRLGITSKTALEYMRDYFNELAESWSRGVKSITGVDWSPVLDEQYIALWVKYAELTRIIEARIWIRNYLARLMGWLLYRVSYGWLSREDYVELLESVREKEWLTPVEAEFFTTIFDWLSGVVRKEYIPTPHTLATFSEYMVIPEETVERVFELQRVPEEFRPLYGEYIRVRPVKSDFKSLLTAYRRAYTRGYITEDQWKQVLNEAVSYGFRDIEISIIQRLADIETTMRTRDEYIPTLSQLIQFSEYVGLPDELVDKVLQLRKVDEPWASLWKQLIRARVLSDDVRALLSAHLRALRSGVVVPEDVRKQVEQYFSMVGITPDEIRVRELAVQLEMSIEYVPTLSQLVQFAEYTGISEDLVRQVLQSRRVGEPWASLWVQLIRARIVSDDVRVLVNSYYRAIRSGAIIPDDVRRQVEQYFRLAGITSEELAIRDLAVQLDLLAETLPSPSTLVSMAEYIDIPLDYLTEILQRRRLEKRFIDLWLRYVQVRMISTEVNRIVSVFERIYERFSVPDALVKQVAGLMAQGGWTSREMQLFSIELELRKTYRALVMLIPTVRGAVGDLTYLPNYDALLQDLFRSYGLEVERYKAQLEYYRSLVKNRRMWRHFSWWRTQLTYAYQYGAITLDDAKKLLAKWKDRGLVDDDEISAILEGMELRRKGYATYRATYYR